jgi:Ca-activated chloride channel family protein
VVPLGGGEAILLVHIVAGEASADDRQAPLDVAFVLDRSGSMAGGKLTLAKTGVDLAISRLRSEDRMALVVYDDSVDTVQSLEHATPRSKTNVRLALHGVDPGGSTNLSGGWMAGCGELANAEAAGEGDSRTRIRRVVLLTDGLANVGITQPEALSQHAGELRRRGIPTTTIGVGEDFDEGLLSAMAEAGGGNFEYAANASDLRDFFSKELQSLFNVTATSVGITLQVPPGIETELIAAFPVESQGGKTQVAVGDVVAGDEIDLVFSIHSDSTPDDVTLSVVVSASWTDPRADCRREMDASPETLRFTEQAVVDATPADPAVEERAALQRAAAERRAGLELDRQGRFAESRARMQFSKLILSAAPQTDVVRESRMVSEVFAAAPPSAAYGAHSRKRAQYHEELRRRGRYRPSETDRESEQ